MTQDFIVHKAIYLNNISKSTTSTHSKMLLRLLHSSSSVCTLLIAVTATCKQTKIILGEAERKPDDLMDGKKRMEAGLRERII